MSTITALPTGTWTADPIHSSAGFRVRHMGTGTFRSSFGEIAASYDGDAGKLTGEVPVESIDIKLPDFRAHVLAPDFFDAASYPTVTFVSTDIRPGDGDSVTIEGDLTIRGITKRFTATGTATEPGPDIRGGQRFGLELTVDLDRRDYGLDWNAELPGGKLAVEWNVALEVALELAAQDEQA